MNQPHWNKKKKIEQIKRATHRDNNKIQNRNFDRIKTI